MCLWKFTDRVAEEGILFLLIKNVWLLEILIVVKCLEIHMNTFIGDYSICHSFA